MQPEELETLASLRPNFPTESASRRDGAMPRKIPELESIESLYEKMKQAHSKWEEVAHLYMYLNGRNLPLQKTELVRVDPEHRKKVTAAFDSFDEAIRSLVD